jgi:phosphatidylglycerol lysyltransferase
MIPPISPLAGSQQPHSPTGRAGPAIGHGLSHLLYQEDKRRFWSEDRSAYLLYAEFAGKRIVLGDPVGTETDGRAAMQHFLAAGGQAGRDCLFYQVGPKYAALLEAHGFRTMKTGEEATVDLPGFHTNGKDWVKLRTKMNKAERDGYRCEVALPPHAATTLSEVRAVSDSWLEGKREKSFSVGSYSETYAASRPIATLRAPSGELLAFVTLAEYERPEGGRRLAVDLMRFREGTPSGGMEVLFVRLLQWGQANGYEACSLGASPLANACDGRLWLKWVRRAARRHYNFEGLRHFKAKFRPQWEDRFLAFPGRSPLLAMLHVAALVHRRRGVRGPDVPAPAAAAVQSSNS